MTTTKAELYGRLLELRTAFQNKLQNFESARVLESDGAGYTNHQADDATMFFDQTASVSAVRAAKDRLHLIERAISRHKAGTYGICENCGREIDIARLEAMPYTPLCLRCAEAVEYHAGM